MRRHYKACSYFYDIPNSVVWVGSARTNNPIAKDHARSDRAILDRSCTGASKKYNFTNVIIFSHQSLIFHI